MAQHHPVAASANSNWCFTKKVCPAALLACCIIWWLTIPQLIARPVAQFELFGDFPLLACPNDRAFAVLISSSYSGRTHVGHSYTTGHFQLIACKICL
jgi:hypothetical protein